eukprot:ctg_2340.g508
MFAVLPRLPTAWPPAGGIHCPEQRDEQSAGRRRRMRKAKRSRADEDTRSGDKGANRPHTEASAERRQGHQTGEDAAGQLAAVSRRGVVGHGQHHQRSPRGRRGGAAGRGGGLHCGATPGVRRVRAPEAGPRDAGRAAAGAAGSAAHGHQVHPRTVAAHPRLFGVVRRAAGAAGDHRFPGQGPPRPHHHAGARRFRPHRHHPGRRAGRHRGAGVEGRGRPSHHGPAHRAHRDAGGRRGLRGGRRDGLLRRQSAASLLQPRGGRHGDPTAGCTAGRPPGHRHQRQAPHSPGGHRVHAHAGRARIPGAGVCLFRHPSAERGHGGHLRGEPVADVGSARRPPGAPGCHRARPAGDRPGEFQLGACYCEHREQRAQEQRDPGACHDRAAPRADRGADDIAGRLQIQHQHGGERRRGRDGGAGVA